MSPTRDLHTERSRIVGVVMLYVLFAALWILLSDLAVQEMFGTSGQIVQASMAKGWLFVTVTALLLYGLVRRLVGRIEEAHRRELAALEQGRRNLLLLGALAESSDDAIFAKDTAGRYIFANPAAARFVGKAVADVLGHDDRDIFPAQQAAAIMAFDRQIVESAKAAISEETLDTAIGPRSLLTTKGPLLDESGSVIGIYGIVHDISERKLAEDRLRDREEKLDAIVRNSPSVLSLKAPDGRYALANPNLQRIHGLSEAEITGKTDFDLYPEDFARAFRANDELVLSTLTRHSVEETVPVDGGYRLYVSHMFPVLGPRGEARFVCRISLDITARRAAEEATARLTEDISATLKAIPDLLFELDAGGHYLRVEATAHDLLAAPAEQLLGHTVQEILPAAAAQTVMEAIGAAAVAGTDYGRTITLPLPAGPRHFELSVARKTAAAESPARFVVLSRDITARKDTEEELKRRNAELERFNRATVGRELDMVALKQQINALSQELGRAPPFRLDFLDGPDQA